MSTLDKNLLRRVLARQQKEAYVPPTPPPMDPAMMGGAPPMDPSMMGGAPPMDPAMMGGMPPMDPAMMGGAPQMDPAMMAAMVGGSVPPPPSPMMGAPAVEHGAPPPSPDMVGSLPPEQGAEEKKDNYVTNKQLDERFNGVENMLAALLNGMGIPIPENVTMLEEAPVEEPPPGEASPEEMGMGSDEAFSLMAPPAQDMPAPLGDQASAGIPGMPSLESGIPKTASDMHISLASYMEQLRRYS